jgi:WD40 repeat protein
MENPEIIDNIEFSPRILQPTGYTKVKSKNKRTREFDKLFLAQELRIDDTPANNARARIEKTESPDQNAVWAIAFSRDGKFLAAAGQNRIVKVWSVLSSLDERDVDDEENEEPSSRPQLRAAVFKTAPVRMFTDHDGPVLDLSWSKVREIIIC